jgi:hypothetical protein
MGNYYARFGGGRMEKDLSGYLASRLPYGNEPVSYSLSFDEIRALGKRIQSLKSHQPLTHVRHASQAARRLAGMTDVCQRNGWAEEPVCGLLQRVSGDDVRTSHHRPFERLRESKDSTLHKRTGIQR